MGIFDKFLPGQDPLDDIAAEQKKKDEVNWVRTKLEEIRTSASRTSHEGIWMQNTAYVLGFPGMQWNAAARSFAPVNNASSFNRRNKIYVNKLLPALQNRLARLCKNQPRYDVRPNDSTQEAKDNAKFKLDILMAKWDDLRINQKRSSLIMWAQQTGHAYLGVYWDDTLGNKMFNAETGEVDFEGDIRVDVISPFEIFPDPQAKCFDDARYFIRAKVRPLQYFRDHYGEKGAEVKSEETWLLSAQFENRINSMNTRGPSGGTGSGGNRDTALELSYYERPCKKYPNGRFIVEASGIRLVDEELPVGKIPLVKFDDITIGGKYYSECVTTHARPIQDQYNQLIRRRAEWTNRLLKGGYLSPRGNGMIREALTDEQAEVIQYDVVPNAPGGGEPKPLQIPMIPQWAYTEEDKLDMMMNEIMGLGEASQGNLPSASIPAIGMQLLVEQDQTRIGVMIEQHEFAFADVGMLILDYVQKLYVTPRKMKFAGKNSYIVKDVSGEALQGSNDVSVVRGSMNPSSKSLRRQELLNLYDRGLLGDPADPKVRQNLLADLEFGDISEPYLDIAIDQNRIKKFITDVEGGIFPDIDEADNFAEAYKEFSRYRKSEKFTTLEPEIQQLLIQVRQVFLDKLMEASGAKPPEVTPEMQAEAEMAANSAEDMQQVENPMDMGENIEMTTQEGALN